MAETRIGSAASTGIKWGIIGALGGAMLGAAALATVGFALGALAVASASLLTAPAWFTPAMGAIAAKVVIGGLTTLGAIWGGVAGGAKVGVWSAVLGAAKGGLTGGRSNAVDMAQQQAPVQTVMMQDPVTEARLARLEAANCGDNPLARTGNAERVLAERQRQLAMQGQMQQGG